MAITPAMEICAVIGAFIGCMIGTLGPYYKEKKKLGLDDVSIFFDKKFLKATFAAGILSAVTIGGVFPVILENVNPLWSYTSTIVFSATLALTLNLGGNVILSPSLITEAAKKQAIEKQTSSILNQQLSDVAENLKLEEKAKRDEEEQQEAMRDKQKLMDKVDSEFDVIQTTVAEEQQKPLTKKVEFKEEEQNEKEEIDRHDPF